jgi:signal transduction histidine kinase
VRGWRDGGQVHITVRDHGIGIPASDLPHVFDRFHRASNVDARSYAGIGLGLYICRGIAEEHDGRIWVESAVGQGSTFHVTLPGATEGKLN